MDKKTEKGDFKHCLSCGSTDDSTFRYWCIDPKGFIYVLCRNCRKGTTAVPDVYYGYGSGTHTEENIADPKTGAPIPFWDKASKKDAMRRAGVMEAGDRIHGSRNEDMLPKNRKKYI